MTRPAVIVAAFVLGCIIVLALILTDRMNDDTVEVRAATERHNDRLGDPLAYASGLLDRTPPTAPPTTTTTAVRVKRQQTASARPALGGAPYPTDQLLERLARCETGGKMDNPNTGNGYYGFFQFDLRTWQEVGGTGYPHEHSFEVQRERARDLILRAGWGRFPHCSRAIGAR